MMKKTLLILTSLILFGFTSFANLKFDINNCEGSYITQYSLENRDSIRWSLDTGYAIFTQGDNHLSITKATNGTVLKQLNYYDFMDTPVIEYYTINLPDTCLNNNVTQAHVGLSVVDVSPCQFSYTHQPQTRPTTNETANWTLIQGKADFNFEKTGDLTISDATETSVFVYSISNDSIQTYDTLTIKIVESLDGCVGIDQGQNDSIVNCGDSSPIFAKVNGKVMTPNNIAYTYVWSSPSEGITINKPNSYTTDFTITTSGAKVIQLKVYSQLGNLFGTHTVTFTSNCTNDNNTFEINNCNFPYYHQYGTPQPSDSVVWEVESGYAEFISSANLLKISDAKDSTILLKKVYHNLNFTVTKYVININGNCQGQKYTLEGHVTAQQEKWKHGMIFLYDTSKEKFVDSVQFENGIYLFRNVSAGTYTVYAVPYQDSILTKPAIDFIPTYYVNKMKVEDANTFEITGNTFSVDVSLLHSTTVSLADFNETNVSAYPNPFSDELMIEIDQNEATIIISTIQGNIIYNGILNKSTSLNTSDWGNGIYFVEVTTEKGVKTLKVIK